MFANNAIQWIWAPKLSSWDVNFSAHLTLTGYKFNACKLLCHHLWFHKTLWNLVSHCNLLDDLLVSHFSKPTEVQWCSLKISPDPLPNEWDIMKPGMIIRPSVHSNDHWGNTSPIILCNCEDCNWSPDITLEISSSSEKFIPWKRKILLNWKKVEARLCEFGRVREMLKDFIAAGMCFPLGNMHIMNWGIVLEEVNSFDQHLMPLCFDDVQQFAQQNCPINCGALCQKIHNHYFVLVPKDWASRCRLKVGYKPSLEVVSYHASIALTGHVQDECAWSLFYPVWYVYQKDPPHFLSMWPKISVGAIDFFLFLRMCDHPRNPSYRQHLHQQRVRNDFFQGLYTYLQLLS